MLSTQLKTTRLFLELCPPFFLRCVWVHSLKILTTASSLVPVVYLPFDDFNPYTQLDVSFDSKIAPLDKYVTTLIIELTPDMGVNDTRRVFQTCCYTLICNNKLCFNLGKTINLFPNLHSVCAEARHICLTFVRDIAKPSWVL